MAGQQDTSWISKSTATIEQLGRELDLPKAEARALLDELGVPVVRDVFAREDYEAAWSAVRTKSGRKDVVTIVEQQLLERGLIVRDAQRGKPTIMSVAAQDEAILIGMPYGPEPKGDPYHQLKLTPRRPKTATVYSASSPRQGYATFTITLHRPEPTTTGRRAPSTHKGTDTNFFVLLEKERVWVVNRDELLDIHEKVNARPRAVPCFSKHPNPDRLRVFLPVKHKTDWDLDIRVFPASKFKGMARG